MSKEALSQFMKKVAEDPELQNKLIEFAARQGFDFTNDELSEADLDSISGGPTRRKDIDHATLEELASPTDI